MQESPPVLLPLWETPPCPDGCPVTQPHGLRFYAARTSAPAPCMVICPGGGYRHLAPHEGEDVALWLNQLGCHAVVVAYRVAPHRHPSPLMDVLRAIRLCRFHALAWGIDPRRVGVLGHSAGGHLAACAATMYDDPLGTAETMDAVDQECARPDVLVLGYPVITFGASRHDGSMRNLLGAEPTESARAALSVETRVTAHTPPTFLWHGMDDTSVPVENSLLFLAALRAAGVPCEAHLYESAPHGIGLSKPHPVCARWSRACAEWLADRDWTPVTTPNDRPGDGDDPRMGI